MIVKCEFALVGIVLTYSKQFDVFRVDHILKPDVVSGVEEYVMQKGQDLKLLVSFAAVVKGFIDTYGAQLRVVWTGDTTHTERRYLQLRKIGVPAYIGLDGAWTRWMEM